MNEVEEILNEHYNNYNEEERLVKDKAHQIEYITTTKYIEKYLKNGNRILEVGAGTGRYSINYAKKGYRIDSVELVKRNLDILKSKITKDMDIDAIQGNCLDLSVYNDNTFDITLILGPLYHLYEDKDAKQAISEAIRVTKKGGKIFIAFIPDDAVVMSYGIRGKHIKDLKNIVDKNWKVPKIPKEIFATYRIEELQDIINEFDVKELELVSADGISSNMAIYVNELDKEEFELYVDYHLRNCDRRELLGFSSHLLEIVEKL
jgi:ubiquinone/menaquinone biosynthesis C-methylase UbiE